MKIEAIQDAPAGTLLIADAQTLRLEATTAMLAYELQQPREKLPVLSMPLRALALLLGRSPTAHRTDKDTPAPPAPLFLRAMWLARALRAVAEYLRMSAQVDQKDLASKIERGGLTTLAFAVESGLTEAIEAGVLTEQDIQSLLMYARSGNGPAESQRNAVMVINAALQATLIAKRPDHPLAEHYNLFDDYDYVLDRAVLIRLREFARALLAQPAVPSPTVMDDPKNAVAQRVETMIGLASLVAALPVMAISPLLDHTLEFLTHPWLRFTAKGRLADEISRIAEQHAVRRMALPSGAPWTELSGLSVLDCAVAGPWPHKPKAPTTILPIAAPAWGKPLAADFSTKVAVTEELIATMATLTWRLSETAASAMDIYRRAAGERAANVPLLPVTITRDLFTGEFAALPTTATQVPIAPLSLIRPRWHANTDNFRLLHEPLSRWHFYTHAYVVEDVRGTKAVQAIPSIIEKEEEPFAIAALKAILPFIEVFDAPAIPASMTLNHLLDLWGITPVELHALLSQMGDGTSSFMARAFADRLRFIGMLTFEVNGHHEIIPPMDGMWYHTRETKKFLVAEDKKIKLGERANVQADVSKEAPVGVFFLHPFSHIPNTADVTKIASCLQLVGPADEQHHKPLVVWEAPKAFTVEPVLPIVGWKLHSGPVSDIVLNPAMPSRDAYIPTYVVPGGKNEYPLYSHAYNAIVSLTAPMSDRSVAFSLPAAPRYIMNL